LDLEAEVLAQVQLFRAMDRSQLKLLAFSSTRVNFERGEQIFDQEVQAFLAYVVIEEESKVYLGEGEHETVIDRPEVNVIIGEMSLLTDNPRSASFGAVSKLTVLRAKKDVFLELVQHNSNLALELFRAISDRMINMMHQIEEAA
jgi:CRP-like cAMP-binding protein